MLTRIYHALVLGLAGLVGAALMACLLAWPATWLWNYAAVDIFRVREVDPWHMLGLLVLLRLLFPPAGEK